MNKYISKYNIYFLIYTLFGVVFIENYHTIHFENQGFDTITRILHPEFPKGGLDYNPIFHYHYLVAFFAKIFNLNFDSPVLPKIFWFVEQALTIAVLIKIVEFLFKEDQYTLILALFIFLAIKSGETDQKTLLRPIQLLAVYYFIKNKFSLSAIFSGLIFYLHVGWGLWWFLPSIFGLGIRYLLKINYTNFIQMIRYGVIVTTVSLPILYYYLTFDHSFSSNNGFLSEYWYGMNNSVLNLIYHDHSSLIYMLVSVSIFVVGYNEWKRSNIKNDSIVFIAIGVFLLFILSFLLVDVMFNGMALKLQFLRSFENIYFFSLLFISFLLSKQIQNNNYFFTIILLLIFIPNPFWIIYSYISFWNVVNIFYISIIFYVIFYRLFINFFKKIMNLLNQNIYMFKTIKLSKNIFLFINSPTKLIIFIIFLTITQQISNFTNVESYIKSLIGFNKNSVYEKLNKTDNLLTDVVDFTNKKITNNQSILLTPFTDGEFVYFTKHKTFIDKGTLWNYIPTKTKMFQNVFQNDLNYTIKKIKKEGSWKAIWQSVDEKLINQWKNEYSITHVIREKSLPLNFPIIYENQYYYIYTLINSQNE